MVDRTRRAFLQALSGALPGLLLSSCPSFTRDASLETRSLKDLGSDEEFDVCVIGSGPAGALLAAGLVRHGIKTLVLESGLGPGESDSRFGRLDAYSASGKIYPVQTSRFRGVGGTSNLWTGSCTRLEPGDLSAKNAYAPPGAPWPISYSELQPYYQRAEVELSVRGADQTSLAPPRDVAYPLPLDPHEGISDLEQLFAGADLPIDPIPQSDFDGEPLRTARTHLPAFSRSPHGTLAVGCTVTRILASTGGGVSGFRVQALDGTARTIRARFYAVACGVVETCRLLLLSRSEQFADGGGIRSDLLGRCFMTQYAGASVRARIRTPGGGVTQLHQVAISRKFRAAAGERGLGAVQLRLIVGPGADLRLLLMLADLEIEPSPDNRITLDPSQKDYFGNPGAHVHLAPSQRDRATSRYAESVVREVASQLKLDGAKHSNRLKWSSHHHMGGSRMGSDPRTSVVDADLRVHGTPNLYVAGGAPFVTCGVAHPTLTISALALRLADHLAGRIRSVASG